VQNKLGTLASTGGRLSLWHGGKSVVHQLSADLVHNVLITALGVAASTMADVSGVYHLVEPKMGQGGWERPSLHNTHKLQPVYPGCQPCLDRLRLLHLPVVPSAHVPQALSFHNQ
jgi:hypothetical protein